MPQNPLFPTGPDVPDKSSPEEGSWQAPVPIPPGAGLPPTQSGANPAADLVRQKLARIYADEPDATRESQEATIVKPRSKHQQFMYDLSTSGKGLAEIQTEWHNYYVGLPDEEKHQVWQEFYETAAQIPRTANQPVAPAKPEPAPKGRKKKTGTPTSAVTDSHVVSQEFTPRELPSHRRTKAIDRRTAADLRRTIRHKVSAGGKLSAKHHLQSLLFGLGLGLVVIFIFLFGFFNQFFIAPFLQPGRYANTTPIILSSSGVAPTNKPEVIIPKINLELPVDYTQTSIDTTQIEDALDDATVHYPITSMVGQKGNAVFFGHSSGSVFSPGHYKYAFGLLHLLQNGDTFYLTKNKKVYVYKVVAKRVVEPTEVSVLGPVKGYTATATLITCDPPGTSLHRLIVIGEQISPDPTQDPPASPGTLSATGTATTASTPLPDLPGNVPSLWGRLTSSAIGKIELVVIIAAGIAGLVWSGRLVKKGLQKN